MELKIHTRNVDVTPRLQEHVEKKVSKLDKYLPNIHEVRVDLAMERRKQGQDQSVAQLTLRNSRGVILRAEEKKEGDIYAALDRALDKMYRQIERYKGKRKRRGGGKFAEADAALALAEPVPLAEEEEEAEDKLDIVRRKRVELNPMTEEEAIDQMELLGHDFFIFLNATTARIGVLYRREDGNYGVLEPDVR
ncbi:MAG TPA: ribosome-associated translation inhibitor RaiA [Aggregatilinea sp.]|uniref:ribosome hibernation-promoting factor, HPF/YfiA family n=1 Tax=Aggregatilinea sp. TaxID=2806333 RepID=UPI002CD071C5|nr:ribosome-associated translation inhibitor RaiA [Aggregatilinea sp.]HML20053.1 ribosome-associated translation inhibitor RaiA [Aggregatilinea sp.]